MLLLLRLLPVTVPLAATLVGVMAPRASVIAGVVEVEVTLPLTPLAVATLTLVTLPSPVPAPSAVLAAAAVVAPVPPLARISVPPTVSVPAVVMGPPVSVRPVVPPLPLTLVTVPLPPPPPPVAAMVSVVASVPSVCVRVMLLPAAMLSSLWLLRAVPEMRIRSGEVATVRRSSTVRLKIMHWL